jgi:DNA-binding IclR family transcriptional regulator
MTVADDDSRYRAPALDKGLDIIELLASTEEGMTQGEIARALDRTPNEIFRMLDRLVRRNYVTRREGDLYELTLKLFILAHQRPPIRRLVSRAVPVLRRFSRLAGQASHLVVYDRGDFVVMAQVDSPGYWGMAIRVGSRVGMINTGSGHVLLAFSSPAERALMFEEHEMMPTEKLSRDFEARLAKVRKQGFEMMDSLQTPGVVNLSAPVFGPNGTVLAAFTCPFIKRIDDAGAPDRAAVLGLLVDHARQLSHPATAEAAD